MGAPPLLPSYFLEILISVLFVGYLASSWNVLGGYAGQFSFGPAAFFGVGAYTSTLLFLRAGISPWLGMLAGGCLASAFGLGEGYLSFRYGLRGPYFSLVTLAFAERLRVVAVSWKAVGSSLRLVIPSRGSAPHLFVFATKLPYYYVILSMALGAPWLTRWIQRSKLGYALLAIRENEEAAEAAGVNALGMKLRALAISSFLSALGGTFSAQHFAYIDPSLTFGPSMSIQGLLQAIVGGAGTALGSLGRDRRLDRAQRRRGEDGREASTGVNVCTVYDAHWMEDYKTSAPDSAPGMRSPLEYRSTEPVLL